MSKGKISTTQNDYPAANGHANSIESITNNF